MTQVPSHSTVSVSLKELAAQQVNTKHTYQQVLLRTYNVQQKNPSSGRITIHHFDVHFMATVQFEECRSAELSAGQCAACWSADRTYDQHSKSDCC